jgi:hypothetical protein
MLTQSTTITPVQLQQSIKDAIKARNATRLTHAIQAVRNHWREQLPSQITEMSDARRLLIDVYAGRMNSLQFEADRRNIGVRVEPYFFGTIACVRWHISSHFDRDAIERLYPGFSAKPQWIMLNRRPAWEKIYILGGMLFNVILLLTVSLLTMFALADIFPHNLLFIPGIIVTLILTFLTFTGPVARVKEEIRIQLSRRAIDNQ